MATKPVCSAEHAYLFSRDSTNSTLIMPLPLTVWSVISATHFNLMLVDKKVRSEVYYTVIYTKYFKQSNEFCTYFWAVRTVVKNSPDGLVILSCPKQVDIQNKGLCAL